MGNEIQGELEPIPGELTSESISTDDPNATVPSLSFGIRAPKATGDPPQRYRILGPLGEGGMGIVYRAEDTRLGRHIAIKTVPAALTANRRAKERFLNEARAASALDHPNICTVYEIEETGEGQLYLTMPCYDGETLKSRLQRGPLPIAEAVHIAQQAARGLAKAHQLGIVHCDVKPANLMLTGDGLVKVLDFGIARLSGQASPVHAGPSGTPRYRSPEQARGDEVEAASDIWSLGIVLYEMVTGEPPKRGEHGEVLQLELPESPPELDRILSRMLAFDPADRYPQASALLADLERLAGRISPVAENGSTRNLKWKFLAAALGIAALCLGTLGGYVRYKTSDSSSPQPPARLASHSTEPILSQVTDFPGQTSDANLSPDGATLLYVRVVGGRSHIFSQPPIRGAEAIDLSANSPADDGQPSFSPDGRHIAFRSERESGGLFLMPAKGGPVRRLTNFGFHPAWSPDGREIVCDTVGSQSMQRGESSEIFRIDVATSTRRRVTSGDAARPSWSPHGRRIAYWGFLPQKSQRVISTVPVEGGEAVAAVDDDHINVGPVWAPDGSYLYFTSDRSGILNLWRVPIDEASGRVRSEPEAVTKSQQAAMGPSFSHDGRLIAFSSDSFTGTLERIGFDPAAGRVYGPTARIIETSGWVTASVASPDGNWLLYRLLTPPTHEELFLVRPDGSGQRRFIGDVHDILDPTFSPDSSRVAFHSARGGKYEIWTIGVNGRGLTQETSVPAKSVSIPLWSPDGKKFACTIAGRAALIDLTRPLRERSPQFLPLPERGAAFCAFSWSADGKWLAGSLYRQGPFEPGILLYSLTDKRYVRLTSSGYDPVWLHDSRHLLYYVKGDRKSTDKLMLVDAWTKRSRPVLVPTSDSEDRAAVSLSPDDRFLYIAWVKYEGEHIWLLDYRSGAQAVSLSPD